MEMRAMPVGTWMVAEPITLNSMKPVSLHPTRGDAEAECDRRNKQMGHPRYTACIALQPVAERMGCAVRLVEKIG